MIITATEEKSSNMTSWNKWMNEEWAKYSAQAKNPYTAIRPSRGRDLFVNHENRQINRFTGSQVYSTMQCSDAQYGWAKM